MTMLQFMAIGVALITLIVLVIFVSRKAENELRVEIKELRDFLQEKRNHLVAMVTIYNFCCLDDPNSVAMSKGRGVEQLENDELPTGDMFVHITNNAVGGYLVLKLSFTPNFLNCMPDYQKRSGLKEYLLFLEQSGQWPLRSWGHAFVRAKGMETMHITLRYNHEG